MCGIVGKKSAPEQPIGRQVVALMKALADSYLLSTIQVPVAWQRKIREDHPLPFCI